MMKKIMLSLALSVWVFMGCSKNEDDSPKCESCTSNVGTRFEICDNKDGTYLARAGNDVEIWTEEELQEELEGHTIKEMVKLACLFDGYYDD